jgi:kinesin family protein 2/24
MHALDWMMQTSIPEPFQPSPSFLAVVEKGFESEYEGHSMNMKQQTKLQGLSVSSPHRSVSTEKDRNGSSNSGIARIKVVVRKRPINKKELARKEEDIITIKDTDCSLTVHEPKVKVDLTAYVEKHEFVFDAVLDQYVSNDEVYRTTVEPIVPTIFQRTKATCFAYGQTGKHDRTYLLHLIVPCWLWLFHKASAGFYGVLILLAHCPTSWWYGAPPSACLTWSAMPGTSLHLLCTCPTAEKCF